LHQGLTALARVRARAVVALAVLVTALLSAGPVLADRAAIASAHPLATAAGYEILKQGGNAFDAAIAVGAALGVVEPYASGLGGGGFFLLHRASDRRDVMVDARETAPGRATRSMYIDTEGKPNEVISINGALAAAIPGTPAGLVWLAQHYGRLPLSASLAPAITLARDGFEVDVRYASAASAREALLKANAQAARLFLETLGIARRVTFVPGDVLAAIPVQADLYLLHGVLQQWGDDAARAILRNCRAAMPEWATLAIIERLLPARAADNPAAIMLDLHMMTITGGRARSLPEFTALLSEVGLEATKVTPTSSGLAIIEAVPG